MSRRALFATGAVVVVVGLLTLAVALRDGDDVQLPPRSTTTTEPASRSTATTSSTTTSTSSPSATTTTAAPAAPAVVVSRAATTERIVALTFDAGSDAGYTADILDTLAADHVKATFGLTGAWTEANPALVRRIVAEGHQVVNHSYDHPSFTGYSTGEAPLSRADRLDQLARAEASIRAAGGASALPWFRPPYGDQDASVRADVALAGYRYVLMWTVDSLGWRGEPVTSIVARCLDAAAPGTIYLLHVGSASADAAALPAIIDGLRQRGYRFTTVAGLVGA